MHITIQVSLVDVYTVKYFIIHINPLIKFLSLLFTFQPESNTAAKLKDPGYAKLFVLKGFGFISFNSSTE